MDKDQTKDFSKRRDTTPHKRHLRDAPGVTFLEFMDMRIPMIQYVKRLEIAMPLPMMISH